MLAPFTPEKCRKMLKGLSQVDKIGAPTPEHQGPHEHLGGGH